MKVQNNIKAVKGSFYIEKTEVQKLTAWLNSMQEFNIQDYDKKERVSFYDDDNEFYFSLSLPVKDEADFDNNVIDLVDIMGPIYGVTYAKGKNGVF